MKINLYQFNPTTLEFKRVPTIQVIALPLICILAVLFNFIFFRAEIISDWEWKYQAGEKLKKVETKITLEEWIQQ